MFAYNQSLFPMKDFFLLCKEKKIRGFHSICPPPSAIFSKKKGGGHIMDFFLIFFSKYFFEVRETCKIFGKYCFQVFFQKK